MKTAAAVLLHLAIVAAMLASLATMPLQRGYLAEGARASTDEDEVRAASERLIAAGAALWYGTVLVELFRQIHPAGVLFLRFYAGAAVAFAAYRACEVVAIITVWFGHVQGPNAFIYRLAVAAPCVLLLLVGLLHVFV